MPYIGKSPTGSGVRQRYHFTATGGETSLSGADDNSKTLKFTDGEYVDVYLNGILLVQGTDYGVSTANTISSLAALAANDIVEVVVYDIYNVAKINSEAVRARHYYTATGGETSIGTSQIAGLSFAANAEIDVSLNGISLVAGTDYNTTTANTVGGLSALSAGNVIEIVIYEKFQLADALSKAAGGNLGGALGVGTIKEATGTTTAMTIDSTGRILTPARPAFRVRHVYSGSGQSGLSGVVQFNTVDFNIGSSYDTTNHYFVAPISGIYSFQFNGIGSASAGGQASGTVKLRLEKSTDSSFSSLTVVGLGYVTVQSSTHYPNLNLATVLQLNAGEYIRINAANGYLYTSNTANEEFDPIFSGFLVG